MNYPVLRNELLNDPLARGYATMNDADAADSLDTRNRPSVVPIPEIVRVAGLQGTYANVKLLAENASSPYRKVAINVIRILDGGEIGVINFDHPTVLQMLQALVDAGALSAAQRDEIVALKNNRLTRAEEIGLGTVAAGDVQRARAGVW